MPTYLTRPDREIVEVSGVGGMLKFGHPAYRIGDPEIFVILDISTWRLRHTFHLPDITHSGSFGATKRAMTGRDWEAQISLVWSSHIRSNSQPWSGLLEGILIGEQTAGFNVAVIFFVGDPKNYIGDDGNIRDSAKYYAPLALCSNIEMINDARGKEVVRATASLFGNSKLRGYTGKDEALTDLVDWSR